MAQEVKIPAAGESITTASLAKWHKADGDHVEKGERLALFLPRVILNAAVFVDGRWLGECGPFGEPLTRCWNHPLYFEMPVEASPPGIVHVRPANRATGTDRSWPR